MKSTSKKTSRKTSARKSSVGIKSEEKEFDDVDSLVALNNPKEKKRLEGIDERIKFLKTELRSLLSDVKKDKNFEPFADKSSSASMLCLDVKRLEDLETDTKSAEKSKQSQNSESREFQPTFNSTPSKFSVWLNKTTDEMESKSQNEKPIIHTLPNSGAQKSLTSETPLPDLFLSSCRPAGMPLLTEESVEKLLYKSFLLQNSEAVGSQNRYVEPDRSASLTKQQKFKKSKKPQKTVRKERPTQNSVMPCSRYHRRGVGRRLSDLSSHHNGIEVITLDTSSSSNKIPEKNTVCVDLDVSDYDWSEPFDLNKETQEKHSDIQVLEHCKEKPDYKSNELKSDCHEVVENKKSVCHDESGEVQERQVWECPVCFERSKGQEIVATKCGHVFCKKCLEDHISKLSNNCPSCRCDLFSVQDKPFITLFNC